MLEDHAVQRAGPSIDVVVDPLAGLRALGEEQMALQSIAGLAGRPLMSQRWALPGQMCQCTELSMAPGARSQGGITRGNCPTEWADNASGEDSCRLSCRNVVERNCCLDSPLVISSVINASFPAVRSFTPLTINKRTKLMKPPTFSEKVCELTRPSPFNSAYSE